ncbi:MAG TPA: hypothetical protein VFJ57_12045 [Solirubrobacterales bacterium]|nr:hypothetical protein [Solirubrobacterales bacterium]
MQAIDEHTEKPRSDQLHDLRLLADACGESFAYPSTSAEAEAELQRLRGRQQSDFAERAIDRRAVDDGMAARGGAARVRDSEIVGYGSSAHWAVGQ